MNGATESTLQELLLVAKQMNINLERYASQAGTAGGRPSETVASVVTSMLPMRAGFNLLAKGLSLVSGFFSTLGNVLGKVVTGVIETGKNLYNFSLAAAEGTAKLSTFYRAFEALPFGLGTVAKVMADIIEYNEKLLDTYRSLTKIGATFGGDLITMRMYAARSGLTLNEFATVVSRNSELFATMGGNVQKGIDKFVLASAALIGPGSKFSRDLFGLGYTAQDMANGLTTVMNVQGIMGKKNALTADQLAEKTSSYLKELDALAKITGINREELEKKHRAEMEEQAFQVFLDGLGPMQRESLEEQLKIAQLYGPAAVQAVKNGARGIFAPLTNEAIDFQIASKGMYTRLAQDAYTNLRNENMTNAQRRSALFGNLDVAGKNILTFANSLGERGLALNTSMFGQMQLILKAARTAQQTGVSFEEAYKAAKAAQAGQAQGTAAGLAQAEQNIRNFGNRIMELVGFILAPISSRLVAWGDSFWAMLVNKDGKVNAQFEKVINFIQEKINPKLNAIFNWLENTFKYLSESKNVDEFWSRLKEKISEGGSNIWETIKPPIISLWQQDIKPAILKALEGTMEWLIAAMRKNSLIARFLFGETNAEKIEQSEKSIQLMRDQMARNAEVMENLTRNRSPDQLRGQAGAQYRSLEGDNRRMMADIARLEEEVRRLTSQPGPATSPQPKARGGPIQPGNYLIGEKGTELLSAGQPGEIITNENLRALLDRASGGGAANNSLVAALDLLNKQTARMLASLQQTEDYTKRNNEVLVKINGDAFA